MDRRNPTPEWFEQYRRNRLRGHTELHTEALIKHLKQIKYNYSVVLYQQDEYQITWYRRCIATAEAELIERGYETP